MDDPPLAGLETAYGDIGCDGAEKQYSYSRRERHLSILAW
jgi:hypothetical protein